MRSTPSVATELHSAENRRESCCTARFNAQAPGTCGLFFFFLKGQVWEKGRLTSLSLVCCRPRQVTFFSHLGIFWSKFTNHFKEKVSRACQIKYRTSSSNFR